MSEKEKVISVLRALLISNPKKEPMPLHALEREYCIMEGKNIPIFEHRNVKDLLLSCGEFRVDVVDGRVLVTEKANSESLHIKKLVTEQRSPNRNKFISNRRYTSYHRPPPRIFPQRPFVSNAIRTPLLNRHPIVSSKESSNPIHRHHPTHQPTSRPTHQPTHRPTIEFTFDELMRSGNDTNDKRSELSRKERAVKQPEVSSNKRPSVPFDMRNGNVTNDKKPDLYSRKEPVAKQPDLSSNRRLSVPFYEFMRNGNEINDKKPEYSLKQAEAKLPEVTSNKRPSTSFDETDNEMQMKRKRRAGAVAENAVKREVRKLYFYLKLFYYQYLSTLHYKNQ